MLKRKPIIGIIVLVFLISIFVFSFYANALPAENDTKRVMQTSEPAVVFITNRTSFDVLIDKDFHLYSENIKVPYRDEYALLSGGSGFCINPDGYILTNGHVVANTEDDLFYTFYSDDNYAWDLAYMMLRNRSDYSPLTDDEVAQATDTFIETLGGMETWIGYIYEGFESGELKIVDIDTEIFVKQGLVVSGKKFAADEGLKGDIKAKDFEGFTEDGEVKGKDIAIIKVPAENMPTVSIADSKESDDGDSIFVIGYPGVATFAKFLDEESQLEPTLTTGVISAKKKMKDGTEIFQTDADIDHGNSGGPAFNNKGEVIGIASMGVTNQDTFGFLRPSNLAKEFINESGIKVTSGKTDKHFKKGLEYYDKHLYNKAKIEFEAAVELWPNHLQAKDLIKKSQEKMSERTFIEKIQDGDSTSIIIVVSICVILFIIFLIIFGIIILIFIRRKKKKKAQMTENEQKKEVKEEDKT